VYVFLQPWHILAAANSLHPVNERAASMTSALRKRHDPA
jgi:hypothetical protein